MIFVDSGAFVARFRKSDAYHSLATQAWSRLEKSNRRCLTSDLVVAESVDLIAGYRGVAAASQFLEALHESDIVVLVAGPQEYGDAGRLMLKFADQLIGFADCVSFVHMRKNKIRHVFGFDRHFQIAGYVLWPGTSSKD